jgi:NAD(P)-dependent dehydrogenase (short-subunit alcohol dehydrogenase family)
MKSLHGKVVVITGAASGIGEALAQACARAGAKLLLADVDVTRLHALAAQLSPSCQCVAQRCDVAQVDDWLVLANRALQEFGGADVLVNNAGVALIAAMDSMSLEDAHWLMNINFWGVFYGCRSFTPQLQSRPDTLIVNVSSLFAMISLPTQSVYSASKSAVRGLSNALREELRQPRLPDNTTPRKYTVDVLCVHPGGIRTRLVEQARVGDFSAMAHSKKGLQAQFKAVAKTSPEQAAQAIVGAMLTGQTRLLIGNDAKFGDWMFRVFPARASMWFSALLQRLGRRPVPQR